jgi:hypothetical protein
MGGLGFEIFPGVQKMNISTFLSILFLTVCSFSLPIQDVSTAGWKPIDAGGLFTFRLPPGFVERDAQVSDKTTGDYHKGTTRLIWKWRPDSSLKYAERRKTWMNDYEETTTRIRGARANIRTYWQVEDGKRIYHAELNLGNWEKGELQLYMGIRSPDPSSASIANEIFRSIILPMPDPERRERP